ncbi:MAG: beta-galactosidase [Ruminococcus sp.]|nr:beta-galactosidase [Ruminococcus sp.]MDY3895471.1 beta-galactosidase [Candidatus Fimenecus sp.]
MKITINAVPKEVKTGDFNYSDIDSVYGCNTLYFTKNGRPYTVVAGELHFSRLPRERWRETLLKMRDCGINAVSNYVFWNYHEEIKGVFDFSGNKDIAAFLQICKDIDMPCILRIGPWCHGEVIRGGFPKRINMMIKKRCDSPKYLAEVKEYWQGLYKEVAPYLDGKTVIGLQLENEYTGSTEYIRTLRKIAEEIGFRVPFFTMTAWPSSKPDRDFLPMMGGYPDAPWSRGKSALKPNNRFAITPGKTEDEIGGDLFKSNSEKDGVYDYVPFATCETGPGNQVTQHRRPYISEKDGYGVGFAKFASGVNWLGYYMFCGGANPNDRLMQENRLTGYPNNYSIIDYDFEAPISRYGVCRAHGDRLRLMHLFIREFDPEICTKQAFFPRQSYDDPCDLSFLKCSVRADENCSGYFFATAYEKGLRYNDFKNVNVTFNICGKTISLPEIDVKAGAMFFYPFNIKIGSVTFDYILAQPIAKSCKDGKTVCYFAECEGVKPKCSVNGQEISLGSEEDGTDIKDVRIVVIPYEKAKKFHFINGSAYFLDGTVYCDNGKIYCEKVSDEDLKNKISLSKTEKQKLPYNYFLYSLGKRSFYKLKLPRDILKDNYDVVLKFAFDGLNLQVFSGKTLINDYFNIDREFVMHLRDYKKYIENDGTLIIRTAPKTKFGISNVYNEIPVPLNSDRLELISANKTELNII